jgi:hypothetical protein
MKLRLATLCILTAAAGATALGAGGKTQAGPGPLVPGWNLPPSDPDAGRLYPEAIDLLQELRALPRRVALGPPPPPEPQEPAMQAAEPAPPPTPGWVRMVEGPTTEGQRLAYSHMLAGSWEEALAAYRGLYAERPGAKHVTIMLAICERRCGDPDRGRELLQEAAQFDERFTPWLQWLDRVTQLGKEIGGEQ